MGKKKKKASGISCNFFFLVLYKPGVIHIKEGYRAAIYLLLSLSVLCQRKHHMLRLNVAPHNLSLFDSPAFTAHRRRQHKNKI